MFDTHSMEQTPEGLKLTNTVFVTGPLKKIWVTLVAKNVADTAPAHCPQNLCHDFAVLPPFLLHHLTDPAA